MAEVSKRLKIAMIHRDLPSEHDRGGVSYHVHYLADNLAGRGHEVTIFSSDPKPANAAYQVRRIEVAERIKKSKLFQTYLWSLYVSRQDFSGFDVLHAHGDSQFLFSAKPPVIRTFYGSALGEALSAVSLKRKLAQLSLYPFEFLSGMCAAKSVAISQATVRHLPFIKTVIPCGVDVERFRPAEEKSKNPTILFVGMLAGRKRGNLLVNVFKSEIKPVIPDARLWLVCREEVEGEGITWFGKVPLEELIRLYQSAWVFCLPSSYEGFGIPYIEAMACGTPVVAAPNMGAREVLEEGKYGLISNEKGLGRVLIKALRDQDLRAGLAEKGFRDIERFSWNTVAASYESIYLSVMNGEEERESSMKLRAGNLDA